jgi:hypothetical protein
MVVVWTMLTNKSLNVKISKNDTSPAAGVKLYNRKRNSQSPEKIFAAPLKTDLNGSEE